MKHLLLIFAALAFCATGNSQRGSGEPMNLPLDEVLGPNNLFSDAMYGVSMNYPAGWKARGGYRRGWNDARENALFLLPSGRSKATAAVYYQMFSAIVPAPDPGPTETVLRDIAQAKEASRIESGMMDYKNVPGTFVFSEADGRSTLRNQATFTVYGERQSEYFVRVLGPRGYVLFYVLGRSRDVDAVIADIDRMAASLRGPLFEESEIHKDPIEWLFDGK